MTKLIGVTGGSSLHELGPAQDVQLFFDALLAYGPSNVDARSASLLTQDLYRRYIKTEDATLFIRALTHIKLVFERVPSEVIIDRPLPAGSWLNVSRPTLAAWLLDYFNAIFRCAESARINLEGFRDFPGYDYEPIRFVVSTLPWFIIEKRRHWPTTKR